ncbi:hypothetical membrane protein [Microbacterium sp. ru370.1]|nr:hypothetical membrane protein [Microbacterium sp. ru370.1]SIT79408.1 hypothetical membrane protein [Microbacterium sp. RU1D]
MSTLRSAVPVSLTTSLVTPRLAGFARRVGAAPSLHVGAVALIVLVGGLLLAIATTTDPLWWQLHFSQLGTFGDLSSAFFNTTLKVSGSIVVFFAFCVRRDVRRLGRGPVRRGAATVAFVCLNVVGVNLALVGCIPLNTDKDLHDRVAGSMVLGFLALLLTAPFLFHRLGKRMAVGTAIATVWLIISIALFVSATINLALFETIACAAMFAWSGMFTSVLAGAAARTLAPAPADRRADVAHVARRRIRRPLAARAPMTPRSVAPRTGRATRAAHRAPLNPVAPVDTTARRSALNGVALELLSTSPLMRTARPLAIDARARSASPPTASPARDTATPQAAASMRQLTAPCGDLSTAGGGRVRSAMHRAPARRPAAAARPLLASGPRAVSASRAARVGSAGVRRPRSSRPSPSALPRRARNAGPDAVRSLLR